MHVVPHVRATRAAGPIFSTIVSVLHDFAVIHAATIASHIKVTTVFLHSVSSTASCRKLFKSSGTLLDLVFTVLRPVVSSRQLCLISTDVSNLMLRASKLVI